MNWEIGNIKKAGIPEIQINKFFKNLEDKKMKMDSVLMIKSQEIVLEKYWGNWDFDKVHRVYSAGKSITAIAVGLLINDGKLKIEDKICNYFLDKLPPNGVHPFIEAMTIWNLLTMTTAHQSTTYKRYEGDWVESFFQLEPDYMPGTKFSYDTSATHTLSALVERISGKDLLSFLRERILDEIGFSKEAFWEKDPYGVTKGGDGLWCTARDLAAIANLCMENGIYQNKSFISSHYLEEMTKAQVSTSHRTAAEERYGYGYQTWKNRFGGFTFFGIGGQLAVCFPEKKFILVTLTDMVETPENVSIIYDCFYHDIYPYLE